MKFKTTTLLAALVLIGAGGFMAGRVSSPEPTLQDGPAESQTPRSSTASASGESGGTRGARSSRPERPAANPQKRKERLESIVRSENPLERNRALLAFVNQLGPGEFEDAVAHFRSLGLTETRMGEYSILLGAWAQADPLAALAYAKENTRDGFAQDTILTSWASADPDAAIRWAQSSHKGDGPNPYLPGIIRGLVESDPARATELLTSMPRSNERGTGLDYILPHLLRQGSEATQKWIGSIADNSLKNGAMLRAARQLGATDPAGTATWLLANPGEATQRRMDDVYGSWASKDRQGALNSLNSLPAGDLRSNALRGVVSSVATSDPAAAVSLMDQYPDDVTDRVVQNFIWHSFGKDPSAAVGQVARITDEESRDRMYRRTLDAWIERDATAAQAWIQSNPIPESVQNHLNLPAN